MPIGMFAKQCLYQPPTELTGEIDADGKPVSGPIPERVLYEKGGKYDLPDDLAEHWFIAAHLEGYEPPGPPLGSHQYAQNMLYAQRAARLNEPMSEQGPAAAPTPPGTVKAEPIVFAGHPMTDKPAIPHPSFLAGGPGPR